MQNKFFNENAFQYALGIVETNPYEAKERFEDYLEKFPKDYYARSYYVLLLTRINELDLAKKEYNNIQMLIKRDLSFFQSDKRITGFNCIMALAKVKILSIEEKYQELLTFYNNNLKLFENRGDTKYLSYYCKTKLGQINIGEITDAPYRFLQTINYDENMFLEHIKKHQADYNCNSENPNETIFAPDFPINDVINEIKKYIPSDKKICPGLFDNAYYFRYDNCGRVNNKLTNYFTVICFHNTQNIITMCPVNNCEHLPIVDINYLLNKDQDIKIKKISQIDKFNKRFNRS